MKLSFLIIRIFIASFISLGISCSAVDDPPVSSEKEMIVFNNNTSGGIGGRIIKVSNLNAKGEGSLRAALEAEGARIVVFEVGGVIDLEMNKITIRNPNITIAGQTAPAPGITLIRGGIFIVTHNVVVKHIAVRPGDAGQAKRSGWEPDGISAYGENVHHLWVDHCSLSWAVDENLSASGPRHLGQGRTSNHVTFSNNIIAEALHNSSHSKGPHSKGTLVHDNCTEIAIIGNFYANNADRNPYFKTSTTGVIVNNLIYNPESAAIRLSYSETEWVDAETKPQKPKVSIVGNVFYRGPDSENGLALVKNNGEVFLDDNLAFDVQLKKINQINGEILMLKQKPYWLENLIAKPGNQTENAVLKNVGARPAERDPVDQRIIQDFINKKGKILDSQDEVGGYPERESTYRVLNVPTENIQQWLDEMEKIVL